MTTDQLGLSVSKAVLVAMMAVTGEITKVFNVKAATAFSAS